jgi:hypothetical protein
MKLNFNKASKEMNEKINPIGKVYSATFEDWCYGGL